MQDLDWVVFMDDCEQFDEYDVLPEWNIIHIVWLLQAKEKEKTFLVNHSSYM